MSQGDGRGPTASRGVSAPPLPPPPPPHVSEPLGASPPRAPHLDTAAPPPTGWAGSSPQGWPTGDSSPVPAARSTSGSAGVVLEDFARQHVTSTPVGRLIDQVGGVVVGNEPEVQMAVAGFIAGGHLLFEDIPGVGKTLLAKSLARSIGGSFGRVQGTPDLLPSDLTGVSIYDEDQKHWAFQRGPLFNNVVLVDELNRATPRTQSALLEAMAERQVTVDGQTHPLPDPFMVIATQNPHGEQLGTFPLVAGQRDRFMVCISLGLPGREAELGLFHGRGGEKSLASIAPVAELDTWRQERIAVGQVHLADSVARYILDLIDAIRSQTGADHLLSPRSSLMLLQLSRAAATVVGRDHVTPDDVRTVAVAALAHRLVDLLDADLPGARRWVGQQAAHVPVPPVEVL